MGLTIKNLYDDNGYLNIPEIIEDGYTFTVMVTPRGTGKTYGVLKHMIDKKYQFIYLRRTETQKDELASPVLNVFNTINDEIGWNIYPYKISKTIYGYYESAADEEGKMHQVGECLGLLGALSTMSSKRGMDGSRINKMIIDEVCPEEHEKLFKNESKAILNCYETINRNRELKGRKPLQLILMANANTIASEILLHFGLVRIITEMKKKHTEIYKDEKRSLLVVCPARTPIGELKKDTALYRLIGENNEYSKMALDNVFTDAVFACIASKSIKDYKPIVIVGDICIYKHKRFSEFYISQHKSGSPNVYTNTKEDIKKFKRLYTPVIGAYVEDRITYEDEETQVKFIEIINK